jgi:putative transposase
MPMPRRARLTYAGCALHLIQRGNNRGACFFEDADYGLYRDLAAQAARDHGVAVHAYVLMTNHVHLLVTSASQDGASRLMKQLGERYVQSVNRARGRSGTLWEGRFRSCLVEEDSYFLACCRYIEMNPVRARMTDAAADYPWSSHGANAEARADALVTPHPLVLALGADAAARSAGYRALFDQPLDPALIDGIRAATNGGYVLGSERFQREIAAAIGRRTWRGLPGRPGKEPADDHQRRKRGPSLFLADNPMAILPTPAT